MGLIKAAATAIGKGLGDQWKEVIEAKAMTDHTVFAKGEAVRTDGSNNKGSSDIISNGSVIHVYPGQFMMLVDGGKVVDYTAEEGVYTVDASSSPSLFNGQFKDALKEVFSRIQYGGTNPGRQQVFFINLQEIKGIKFGTPSPLNYFDSFYNAELFVRAHGDYSIKITNPLLFYEQVISKTVERVEIDDIIEQYMSEFLQGFSASLNQMSAEGLRISFLASKAPELAAHMQSALDSDWNQHRGFEVDHVGIASISYTEDSEKLINMRNQGAMLSDPSIREGYVQSAVAAGIQAAGSNTAGAGTAFMGMGMGMNAAGSFMGAASGTNMQQMQMNAQNAGNAGMQGAQTPSGDPAQGAANSGVAGGASAGQWFCPNCGNKCDGNFCPKCGTKKPEMQ